MRCVQCQHENREKAKFCEGCGNKLELRCPSCRTILRVNAKFCDNCGTPVRAAGKAHGNNGEQKNGFESRILDIPPISYTPTYLAERIIAEQQAMVARGAASCARGRWPVAGAA